jgi:hypothetical protein
MWYTRDEQALVIGSFYSMNGFQQCVGGLIAYGVAHIKNAAIKNWQVLFTVCIYATITGVVAQVLYVNSSTVVLRLYGACSSCIGCPIARCMPNVFHSKTGCLWQRGFERMKLVFKIRLSR